MRSASTKRVRRAVVAIIADATVADVIVIADQEAMLIGITWAQV